MKDLEDLDMPVNQFLVENNIDRVISVSDTTTTDNSGASMGFIRVLTYEESEYACLCEEERGGRAHINKQQTTGTIIWWA
ncbi:MAG: hypothetical protein JRI22_18710 [Deltaproteobacteria bacterium]|nr:hypothetical protein [Deltaproteobacteria bacterium]